mgnify:CR=1 FL=1
MNYFAVNIVGSEPHVGEVSIKLRHELTSITVRGDAPGDAKGVLRAGCAGSGVPRAVARGAPPPRAGRSGGARVPGQAFSRRGRMRRGGRGVRGGFCPGTCTKKSPCSVIADETLSVCVCWALGGPRGCLCAPRTVAIPRAGCVAWGESAGLGGY